MRVVSLLNSGADIQTEDKVCYILITEKFTFSMVIDDLCTVDTNHAVLATIQQSYYVSQIKNVFAMLL